MTFVYATTRQTYNTPFTELSTVELKDLNDGNVSIILNNEE